MKKKIVLKKPNITKDAKMDAILNENHRLKSNFKKMSVLFELGKQITFTQSIPSILNTILKTISDALEINAGVVLIHDQKPNSFKVSSSIGLEFPVLKTHFKLSDELMQWIIVKNTYVFLNNEEKNPYFSEFLRSIFIPAIKIEPSLFIPIFVKDRIHSMLFLHFENAKNSLDPSEIELLNSLTTLTSTVLHNAEDFQSLQSTKEELDQKYFELSTVYDISKELNATLDLESILNSTLYTITGIVGAKTGILFLLDESRRLLPKAWVGMPQETIKKLKVNLRESIVKKIVEQEQPFWVSELAKEARWYEFYYEFQEKVHSNQLWIPLVVKNSLVGVISLSEKINGSIFTKSNFDLLTTIGSQAATAIKNAELFREMQSLFINSVRALSKAIDARDPYTSGHSERVTEISVKIAKEMALSNDEVELIRFAGTLHDIGKIGVAEEILKKPGKLTDQEYAQMCLHPLIGANIILPISSLQSVVPLVLYHHERFDAKGYPERLGADSIPLGARILAVADTYDAMTSDRPYRKALPKEVAIAEIKRCSGTQFDPTVVDYFLKLFETSDGDISNII